MFDFSEFALQDSIANYNRKMMLESEKAAIQSRKRLIESIVDTLVHEYDRTYNTEASRVIDRKFIREGAVIHIVKEAVYSIFESALLIDESVKAQYKDNIKMIFENYFYQILKESNIKTLSQFKQYVKNSHKLFENVIERAEKLVEINESVYNELLETTYNSTSLDNLIIEAANAAADPETPIDDKVAKARAMVDKLSEDFRRFTLEQRFASAHKLIQAAIIILKLGVAFDKIWYSLLDKLLSVVNTIFGRESTESLKEKLMRKTLKEVDNYYYVAIDVAITLKKLQKKFPPDSKDYIKLGDRIASIYKAIVIINDYRQELIAKSQNKPLKEMTIAEFITESDSVIMDTSARDTVIDGIKEKLNSTIADFDPYDALENLQLVNKIVAEPLYQQTFVTQGNSGSNVVLVIIKALKTPNIPDKLKAQFIKEARTFKHNLDSVIETARKSGRHEQVPSLVKQSKRLESFLDQYEKKGYFDTKLVRESISPLLSIDHKVGMDVLASNIAEATQFILLYETTPGDLEYITQMVNEADDHDPDTKEDLKNLSKIIKEEIDDDSASEDLLKESLKLESAIYEKLYMNRPEGISEAAGNELKKGKYPKFEDFIDADEKELIAHIVSASGKDKVVDIIKAKIINVIENEEKKMEKLEEEEHKLISRLSKRSPEGEKELQEAVRAGLGRINVPRTLFESIVMNRSKKYIQEAVSLGTGFDIDMHKETIMGEAITLYTIHETFNTLYFGGYNLSKINKLTVDYYNGKI